LTKVLFKQKKRGERTAPSFFASSKGGGEKGGRKPMKGMGRTKEGGRRKETLFYPSLFCGKQGERRKEYAGL